MAEALKVIQVEQNGSVRVKLDGCGLQPESCGHFFISPSGTICLHPRARRANIEPTSPVEDEDGEAEPRIIWGDVRCGVMLERAASQTLL